MTWFHRRALVFAGMVLIALLWTGRATAQEYRSGSIAIGNPWSRATPPSAQVGGGYFSITNSGAEDDRLVAVRSPVARSVEVHEMKMDGSIMRMRALENGLVIPAKTTVNLESGSYHLMFIDLTAGFVRGARIPATLVFENAGDIDVVLEVLPLGAKPPERGR
jgi:periplasmic copper chaperone A